LVEKAPRIGDSWRNRYESIASHTPIYTDHYPFLKMPENWPKWLGRDKIADFQEQYCQLMGLKPLMNTNVVKVDFDKANSRYTVQMDGPEGPKTVRPRHVVLATGTFSNKRIEPDVPGRELFKGQLYHSAEHMTARSVPNLADKKVVIIGTGTSGHDIAQDFVANGAKNVAMIQRKPIFSFSSDALETILAPWNTEGVTTEEADVMGNSLPLAVMRTMNLGMTQMMTAHDKTMIDGLKKAGMALHTGEGGVGLADHQLVLGGHFYIDQGANQMIVDGRIKIHRCEDGLKEFHSSGLTLANGTVVDADIIVLATGFERCFYHVVDIMGEEFSKSFEDLALFDDEQERIKVSGQYRAESK
jgi:cation diffusion facilitator CzcD-associated flavoprotein CzcO